VTGITRPAVFAAWLVIRQWRGGFKHKKETAGLCPWFFISPAYSNKFETLLKQKTRRDYIATGSFFVFGGERGIIG
jgi:hypothetical protein